MKNWLFTIPLFLLLLLNACVVTKGTDGEKGKPGESGLNGIKGADGRDGTDGVIGLKIGKSTNGKPSILLDAIQAHGGVDQWNQMQTLQYTIQRKDKPEQHLIDLKSRKVRLTHEDYTLGFDGKEVWVTPSLEAFGKGSPRFYHNLFFYFYACPFVFTDPGINYEVLPNKEIEGKTYKAVKISYQKGVGDAPDDYYIAHFNTETKLMDWLLYTVTYYSGEKNEKYNALKYEWQEVNGLMLPSKLTGYKYENGQIGDFRYSQFFKEVSITKEATTPTVFEMPKSAVIAPLKNDE